MEKRCYGCMRLKGREAQCRFCGYVETDQNGPHQLNVGTELHEQYRIGRVLGQGGFGITYLGWDTKLEIPVAVKEYYPTSQVSRTQGTTVVVTANDQSFQEGKTRFLKEARTLAKLRGQYSIVQVHNFFSENNTAYIVMEYVEGITLQEHIRRRGGSLAPEETFAIIRPILQVMDQVHKAGMIHRDISPDNIMLKADGKVKVLDFGTARDMEGGQLTHATQAVLKRGFAPMEQYSFGREIDQRADEYALCATIYYCLTGKRPMDALNRMMDRADIPWAQIPGLTREQVAALEKGTALRAEDRFPDLGALELALFGDREVQTPVLPAAPVEEPEKLLSRSTGRPSEKREAAAEEDQTALISRENSHNEASGSAQELEKEQTALISEAREAASWQDAPEDIRRITRKKKPRWGRRIAVCLVLAAAIGGYVWWDKREERYLQATSALEAGSYEEAAAMLEALDGYRDSQELLQQAHYRMAGQLLEAGSYQQASEAYGQLGDFRDSQELANESAYQYAEALLEQEQYQQAYRIFRELGSYSKSDARRTYILGRLFQRQTIAAGAYHSVGLKTDGTMATAGSNTHGESELTDWKSIVSLSAAHHTVGLRSNGTVVAAGYNADGRCDVSQWQDIIAVAASYHTVGLKVDGTVVAAGNNSNGQCNVGSWTDIAAVAAGYHTVGLKVDGTVVAAGSNAYGQCKVQDWRDITAVAAGRNHTVGLKADGTVVAAGSNEFGQCDVGGWTDIVAVSAGWKHTVGLKADGTVVAAGSNSARQCNVTKWKGIVAVSAQGEHTLGLKADGTVVATGSNSDGQCNVASWTGWKDIRRINR